MPICKLNTTKKIDSNLELSKELTNLLSQLSKKPSSAVQVFINDNLEGGMGDEQKDCIFCEIVSINFDYSIRDEFSQKLCEFLSTKINVAQENIYLYLLDAPSRNIGMYNGVLKK